LKCCRDRIDEVGAEYLTRDFVGELEFLGSRGSVHETQPRCAIVYEQTDVRRRQPSDDFGSGCGAAGQTGRVRVAAGMGRDWQVDGAEAKLPAGAPPPAVIEYANVH
jgi:hypothetical protein